jgi:hypothetical protein
MEFVADPQVAAASPKMGDHSTTGMTFIVNLQGPEGGLLAFNKDEVRGIESTITKVFKSQLTPAMFLKVVTGVAYVFVSNPPKDGVVKWSGFACPGAGCGGNRAVINSAPITALLQIFAENIIQMHTQAQLPFADTRLCQFYSNVTGNGRVLDDIPAAIPADWKFVVLNVRFIVTTMQAFALEHGVHVDVHLQYRLEQWQEACRPGGSAS